MKSFLCFAAISLACFPRMCIGGEFALRDGDTVVFLGDSITAARTYGRIIENYTLLRFPERKVRFLNMGHGGETATGAAKRLDEVILQTGATVVTVAYGVNDIGWGLRADEAHKRQYLEAIRDIVQRCTVRGVRVYICSAAITAEDPGKSEAGFLQKMCDEGLETSRQHGGKAIDVQRTMRDIQKRVWSANENVKDESKQTRLHAADGIHLNDLGQLAMAFAILKGLGAPPDVSSATVDAANLKAIAADGCAISKVQGHTERLEFTRLDEGLPLNNGLFFALNFRFVPIPDQLNRYLLSVRNLTAGRYAVTVDGRKLGTFTARQLACGINIASSTASGWQPGGPWDAQATVLKSLTEARDKVTLAGSLANAYSGGSAATSVLNQQQEQAIAQLEAMQRTVARPRPYRFVVERLSELEKTPSRPEKE